MRHRNISLNVMSSDNQPAHRWTHVARRSWVPVHEFSNVLNSSSHVRMQNTLLSEILNFASIVKFCKCYLGLIWLVHSTLEDTVRWEFRMRGVAKIRDCKIHHLSYCSFHKRNYSDRTYLRCCPFRSRIRLRYLEGVRECDGYAL